MTAISAAPADILAIKTNQERCGLHRDHQGNLWFLGWDESPVIYRYDGKDSVSWTLPPGTFLSPHGAFASAADGTVFIGGSGPVVHVVKGDTLDVLPKPKLRNAEDRSPFAMACSASGLYATFAGWESRKELHRFAGGEWVLLSQKFKDLSQLAVFQGNIAARELEAELVTLDETGTKGAVLVDKASSSTSKILLGESRIVVYSGRSLAVLDASGKVEHKIDTPPSQAMGHVGADRFMFVDESGAVFVLDANDAQPSLVAQPYKKALKSVTGIEVDRAGNTWFRQMAARKSYFTVADPSGKLVTVKNK